jgi:hypothetical protein
MEVKAIERGESYVMILFLPVPTAGKQSSSGTKDGHSDGVMAKHGRERDVFYGIGIYFPWVFPQRRNARHQLGTMLAKQTKADFAVDNHERSQPSFKSLTAHQVDRKS